MKDRPAMETMVKRYEAMQADALRTPSRSEFGRQALGGLTEQPGRRTLRLRRMCGRPRGRDGPPAPMSFMGTYPAADWDRVRDLVEEVGRKHGFDDVAHVKDEPGDLDMVGEDKYGAQYEFGMAKNTIFDLRTGCHRWNQKPSPSP